MPIVVDNEMTDEPTKLPSAMRKSTRGKRILNELVTSYNNINNLRATGDTGINPVRTTRSKASTHYVVLSSWENDPQPKTSDPQPDLHSK